MPLVKNTPERRVLGVRTIENVNNWLTLEGSDNPFISTDHNAPPRVIRGCMVTLAFVLLWWVLEEGLWIGPEWSYEEVNYDPCQGS